MGWSSVGFISGMLGGLMGCWPRNSMGLMPL